jgi:hypothetical protein
MIDNQLVQAALISKANSSSIVNTHIPSGTVLEYEFQGTDWVYPNARLKIDTQYDFSEDAVSCPAVVEFSWYVFSEKGTSKEADEIAGDFVLAFRGLSFSVNNIKFVRVKVLENIKAIRQDVRTWRAQVRCRSIIHET